MNELPPPLLPTSSNAFPLPGWAGEAVSYYVLQCRPVLSANSPQVQNQHLQVLLTVDGGPQYWLTVNIAEGADAVLYYLNEHYQHPFTARLLAQPLPPGFTALASQPGGLALDYIREQLAPFDQFVAAGAGGAPALAELLTTQLTNTAHVDDARLFVFGSRFTDGTADSPYQLPIGIHDIHLNQGSVGAHAGSNGIYQDGGLLTYYPAEQRWAAALLKFASQATQTDDHGNPLSPPSA